MSHLSVVVPVYNESTLIEELVKRIKLNLKLINEDFEITKKNLIDLSKHLDKIELLYNTIYKEYVSRNK
jgi:hypothetical protein